MSIIASTKNGEWKLSLYPKRELDNDMIYEQASKEYFPIHNLKVSYPLSDIFDVKLRVPDGTFSTEGNVIENNFANMQEMDRVNLIGRKIMKQIDFPSMIAGYFDKEYSEQWSRIIRDYYGMRNDWIMLDNNGYLCIKIDLRPLGLNRVGNNVLIYNNNEVTFLRVPREITRKQFDEYVNTYGKGKKLYMYSVRIVNDELAFKNKLRDARKELTDKLNYSITFNWEVT